MNTAVPAAFFTDQGRRAGLATVRLLGSLVLAILFLLVLLPGARAAQAPVPELKNWVTDTTGTLDSNTQAHLTQTLADLEKRKGSQIAVLVVPSTGDDTIESYARRVFDQWRLGRKKVDDGILFVVAKDDRQLRIEVGYGLEGAVPDLLAGRVIHEQVTPRFKQGDYAGGITAGVESLVKLVDGEALPPPVANSKADTNEDSPAVMLLPLAVMTFFMPAAFAAFAAGIFVALMFGSIGFGIAAAVIAFVLSSIGRKFGAGGSGSAARASRRGGVIGGLGGGFGGGFGGGGGGFGGGGGGGMGGGGGGGSGGGGASGSW